MTLEHRAQLLKMEDSRDNPWNFHTCKFCSSGSKSAFIMCNHLTLDGRKSETDPFVCASKSPEMFECGICGFKTNLKVDLAEHLLVFHVGKDANEEMGNILKWYHCNHCDFMTHSLLVLTKHVTDCNTSFRGKPNKSAEIEKMYDFKLAQGVKWYRCKHCTFQTTRWLSIHNHVTNEHKYMTIKWFKCEQCEYISIRKHHLRTHIQLEHTDSEGQKLHKSDRYSYKATTNFNLKVHNLLKHRDSEDASWFKCEQCEYKTQKSYNLKVHILVKHTNPEDVKWYKCEQCVYKSKTKAYLKRHILIKHSDPQDEQSATQRMQDMKKEWEEPVDKSNIEKHTNPDWFKCEHCEYKSQKSYNVKVHALLKHSNPEDVKWFKCELCEYKSKRNANLKRHILLKHSSTEDLFKCEQCVFKTKTQSAIRMHVVRIHNNPQLFKCEHCEYETQKSFNLKTHVLAKHTNPEDVQWFQCNQCSFRSKYKRNLKYHLRTIHVGQK